MAVVRQESVYQQVLDWMRERIATGDWPVGERIPTETELATAMGAGRNTVREAAKTLTSTGILEIRRGFGTYVRARTELGGLLTRQVGVDEMRYVFEVRRALELEAVRLACERRTEEDLSMLREALADRDHAVADNDGRRYADSDLGLHSAIVAAAHNPVLDSLFAGISESVRATYDFTDGAYDPRGTDVHHRDVVDAIERRDVVDAERAATGYLDPVLPSIDRSQASKV